MTREEFNRRRLVRWAQTIVEFLVVLALIALAFL